MSKLCLVLGGAGFIGANLCEELLKQGFRVRIFDRKNFSQKNILSFIEKIEIFEGDFSNFEDVKSALAGVNYVYHLISTTLPANSMVNPIYDIESNVLPSVQLLQLCVEFKISKMVFISSGGTVYGTPEMPVISENHPTNPLSSYGIVKRTIESYIKLYNKIFGLNACIFRLSNPYGEKQNPNALQGAVAVFLKKAILSEQIEIWGDGTVVRDFIYIKDVVNILVESITIDTPGIVYNLGSGQGTSLNDLVKSIEKLGLAPKVQYVKSRNFDVSSNVLDISLLKDTFKAHNFSSLEMGLGLFFQYLEEELVRNK